MPYYQRVQLMGVTGEAADLKVYDTGPISHFSICIEERFRVPTTGEKKMVTTWVRCSAFGRVAEQAHKVLRSGTWVFAEGRLRMSKGNDGREMWGVNVDTFRNLSRRPKAARAAAAEDENQDTHTEQEIRAADNVERN